MCFGVIVCVCVLQIIYAKFDGRTENSTDDAIIKFKVE